MKDLERAKERIEELKKSLAKIITDIGHQTELLEYECQQNRWDDDVIDHIHNGLLQLSFAMATLAQWWDEDESKEGK
jgi:hypothetical protein